MNSFTGHLIAYACFLAFLFALMRWPRVVGGIAFLATITAGCTEASHGNAHNAITAFVYSAAFGIVALACTPSSKRRATP